MAAGKRKKKESPEDPRERAKEILDLLEEEHPDARVWLDFDGPWQLLIATMLAAQCTDEKVNEVTPKLFERYPTAQDLAGADPEDVRKIIRPTGTFRRKQEAIQRASKAIVQEHGGSVPDDTEVLSAIKGVGRKTAAIVIGNALGGQELAVDTHVMRVAQRLGLTARKTVSAIEKELCEAIPQERWTRATQLLTTHGRRICTAKKPDHEGCPVNHLCDFYRDMISSQGVRG